MTAPNARNARPSTLRRYGPLIGIVVVVAIVVAVVAIASGGGGSDNKTTSGTGTNGSSAKGLPLTYADAKKAGKAATINWGNTCDTTRGTIAIPSTYAPPCVEPYNASKGNGGATSPGVTGDTINLVLYQADPKLDPLQASLIQSAGANVDPNSYGKMAQGYVDLFEKYFQMYGRTVKLTLFTGTGAGDNEAAGKADAVKIATDYQPFAVVGGPNQTPAFRNELAARKILCLGGCALAVPQGDLNDVGKSTYMWGVGPTPEQAGQLTAKMICTQFKGGKAQYGGDTVKTKDRVYGIAHYDTPTGAQRPAFEVLKGALEKCGIHVKTDVSFTLDTARSQETARTVIAKLTDAGVTTVIFTGDPLNPIFMTKEATAQGFFPEWIIGPTVYVDTAVFGRRFDQQQWRHAFGLGLVPTRGVQTTSQAYNLYVWGNGKPPPNNLYGVLTPEVTIFFNGVHLAGANLNPETFRAGLFRMPVGGGGPTTPVNSRGEHGVWPALDLGGSDDAALMWWNPDATGQDDIGNQGKGMYEYTEMGKRYTLNKWPSTQIKLFDPSTSVTFFDQLPAQDQPPDYPSPAR